jgi:general secretion pathway protein F
LIVVLVAAVAVHRWRPAYRLTVIAWFSAMPGIADILCLRRTARIAAMLGLLMGNGITLQAALKIVREVIPEQPYRGAIERVHEQVRNGQRLGDVLAAANLIAPLAVRMLRCGEEAGNLPAIAIQTAQFYEEKFSMVLDRATAVMGPATIILVSTVIGALVMSIMNALLSITEVAL